MKKKILAVILATLMVLCVMPFAAFADATYEFPASASFATSNDLASGMTYVIPAGVTMTVPTDVNLYIPSYSTLNVEDGGKLIVNGTINIQKGGELYVAGTIINSDNVSGEGSALAELRFPAHDAYCTCGKGDDCEAVTISLGTEDLTGEKVTYAKVSPEETKSVALNSTVYVKVEITEPTDKYDQYDDDYINVYFNGVTVPGTDSVHTTKVSTGSDVTLTKFDGGKYFYKDCRITMPSGTGYDTDGYIAGNETSIYTPDDGTFTVKYGETLYFKVNIDEDYNQFPYEVYIYNGYGYVNGEAEIDGEPITDESGATLYFSGIDAAQPDSNGYYKVTVRGDTTIHVIGVVENEKIEMAGDILSTIRNVFDMIRSFFQQILALLGISL